MLTIVIPDPGLREYGGHHPAMINAIANTKASLQGDIQLSVYCHVDCQDDFISATQSKRVSITKHFQTDFYQYFYQAPSLATLNQYINKLTKEYLAVFERHLEKLNDGNANNVDKEKTVFLYHTLSAEHAVALATAIATYNKRNMSALQHCVFLMYNPIKHDEKGVLNHRNFLNYKIGFSLLNKQNNVQCFAAEEELRLKYQYLLSEHFSYNDMYKETSMTQQDYGLAIDLHPCGLLTKTVKSVKKTKTVILYTGDAKETKGFLRLPDFLIALTKQIEEQDISFIIQYTITNDNEALRNVDLIIQQQAKLDKRIKLTTRFWSHSELHNNFARANCILFNYHNNVYKNQSSGVLWLAAFYNLNMVFLTSNWLMEEAEKLNCNYEYCIEETFSSKIHKYLMQSSNSFDKVATNTYRQQLFQDIGEWLLNKYA